MAETRASIRAKYGIVSLEPAHIANAELTEEEAIMYERMIKYLYRSFHEDWDEDDSGDID